MINFSKADDKDIKKYYESEDIEHKRLYDFSKPARLFYDKSRTDCVLKLLNKVGGELLEVGCGSGYYLEQLSRNSNFTSLHGLDYSRAKLDYIRNKIPSITITTGDAAELPFDDNSFDVVLCSEVIEHLKNPIPALREINRVCRKYAIISTPTNSTIYRRFLIRIGKNIKYGVTHIKEFRQDEFLDALHKAGFEINEICSTPVLEFPGAGIFLLKFRLGGVFLYLANKVIQPIFKRSGVFTCVLLVKPQK